MQGGFASPGRAPGPATSTPGATMFVQMLLSFFYQVTGARKYGRYSVAPLVVVTQQSYALAA